MGKKIWFGNTRFAQWVPCPATGMVRSKDGYAEELRFRNGGRWISRSAQYSSSFDINLPVADASDYDGIEAYERFANGQYGSGYLRFVDPMMQDQNLFTPVWAAPGLSEQGWKTIYDTVPSFVDTSAANVALYGWPARYALFNVTTAANAVPVTLNSVFTLLIPPTHTLHMRFTGAVTGTAVMRVQPINLDGTLATVVDLTVLGSAVAPSFTNTFNGATYRAVQVYITRTSAVASTILAIAMVAEVIPTGVTPTAGTRFIPGKGHTGLSFVGETRTESYVTQDRHLMGASIQLAEVEAWK